MEKETEKQNLGSGSIPGLMIKLAVPTIIAQLVNLLYNLVDRIYIGHIRGAYSWKQCDKPNRNLGCADHLSGSSRGADSVDVWRE